MSGNAKWWLNRAGTFAPVSSPGSNVPNYGLTFDVATAPWDDQAQFSALVASQLASRVLGAAQGIVRNVSAPAQFTPDQDPTLWDHLSAGASAAGHFLGEGVKGITGAIDATADKFGGDATLGDQYDKLAAEADKQGLKGWDRLKFIGGKDLANAGKNLTKDPLASKVFWALDKASEYGATAFVAGTEAQKDGGQGLGGVAALFDGDNWSHAHSLVKKYDLNAGEGFVQMFYDDELIDDEKRFGEVRKHNTVFNFGALAFNATMAWKFDPNVIIGKGGGALQDFRRGALSKTGTSRYIENKILAQPTRAEAELLARNAGGIANRVRANRALSLWDKSQGLREMAQKLGYEDFKRLAPFQNSASGVVLSKLLQDVAHDDEAWNLVFRTSIGDQDALPELLAQRADLAPKIDALELGRLPRLESEFEDVATRYEKRLAEQGGMLSNNDRLILTSQRDWFLDQDFQTAKARLDEAKAELDSYKEHESWLSRATRGADDGRQSGVIQGTLDTLNAKTLFGKPAKKTREAAGDFFDNSLYSLGGKVSSFRKDEFSRMSRIIVAPRKPMLKRVGVVNLHDAEEGAQGISSYLDQFTYMAGRQDQAMRDHVLSRWAGATTDVERKQIVDQLEGQGIALVLKKHGITTPEMTDRVRSVLQGKRADAWAKMSDGARYTTVTDESGRRLDKRLFEFEDDQGTVTKVAMPMDPTELPNWRPLTNLTDLDHALAVHKDTFKELDRAHALGVQSRRLAENVYETVGSTLNSLWKPAALISFRWPARVVADESFRVMLMLGVLPHMKAWGEGVTNVLHNTGFVKPMEFYKGRKVKTGSFAEESLRSERAVFDPWDGRAATNPTGAVPADAAEFDKIDPMRHERLLALAAEQREWLRKGQGMIGSGAPYADDALWHGAKGDLPAELRPRHEVESETAHFVGDGFYTTTSPASAENYARGNPNRLYRIERPKPEDVVDLDAKITADQRQNLIAAFDEYVGGLQVSPELQRKLARVRRELHEGNSMSIGSFKGAYEAAVSQGLDFPTEGVELTKWLTRHIEDTYSAKVLKHRSGADSEFSEDVYIWLKPEALKVHRNGATKAPGKPRWAQRFEDRVAAAEKADSRGFFFDPINGRARNKGFAVSVYPGRLRTFDKKPSAAELHWWMEKNADLLANHSNQVAVWADKQTGRWHLDIVRTARRREDAMVIAAKSEANEFFDINDGFTRYMADEDRFGHAAYAARGIDEPALDSGPGTPAGDPAPVASRKRKIGFGTKVYKTADGRSVEVEDVYGSNVDDPNIYFAAHSAKGMAQRLYGGYTKGLGVARARRSGNGARTIHFSDEPDNWRLAQSEYVNRHFRNSPIWLKMLNGQNDREVLSWLTSTPEGRALRQRMGPRGLNPNQWVQDMRAIFDHTLPTAQARLAAKEGNIDPKQWDALIPEELRNDVHGDTILMAEGSHPIQGMWKQIVEKSFNVLGSMPTDALVRHPFARNLYNLRMKNYLASVDGEITQEVLNAAEASARAFATKQVRRLLYNIADENQAVHMLRFVAPFFQAQAEVLERYAHLFTSQPEALARTLQMFYLTQNDDKNKGLWYTVDAEGNPTSKFSHDNSVVFQVADWMHHVPGLKTAVAHKTEIPIPVSSIDLILQGDKPYLPSFGPLVTVPLQELVYQKHPERAEGFMFDWFFPFGLSPGKTVGERTLNALSPAWFRRAKTAATVGYDDSAFANAVNIRYQDIAFAWEREHGKTVPGGMVPKLTKQAEKETRAYWWLRALASFASPVPIGDRSPHQHWIDLARKYRAKYGMDADQKFYDEVGPDFFRYFTESTRSTNGLAPTTAAAKGYLRNKDLVDKAPDLAGIIAGPYAGDGEFNYEVYRWQLRTRKGPGSSETMRELQTPAERIAEGQINQGWIEYGKVASAVDAEMRARGLTSLNSNAALDLRAFKAAKVREVIERNPAWQKAYRSREDNLSGWLAQAETVAFDPSMDGRTDIEGLRNYLLSRQKVQAVLFDRQANGGSASLSADTNADLGGAWNSYLSELTSKNLLFAEIYHRYLEGDDLTVVVN